MPNDVEKLGDVLVGFEPGTPVVFEATYGWAWLAELLHEMDFDAHLAHPAACKAIASARLKNDKVDARTLAQLLRVDLLARRGSLLVRFGSCDCCCGTGPPWSGCARR